MERLESRIEILVLRRGHVARCHERLFHAWNVAYRRGCGHRHLYRRCGKFCRMCGVRLGWFDGNGKRGR